MFRYSWQSQEQWCLIICWCKGEVFGGVGEEEDGGEAHEGEDGSTSGESERAGDVGEASEQAR
jgi:hypothetical protein